jgi:hypothetical protein
MGQNRPGNRPRMGRMGHRIDAEYGNRPLRIDWDNFIDLGMEETEQAWE